MLDVERSIVAHIERVGIECTRGVDGIRIGVDIEVAAHLSGHGIDRLVRRSGRTLLAVSRVADEVQRQFLADVIVGVDICRITLHLALP